MKLARCQFYQDASSTKMPVLPRCPFHESCPLENKHETGKMPVLPRCQFYQDASSTKMPVLPRCQFYQDASSTKMPVLPRCQFYQDAYSTGATQGREGLLAALEARTYSKNHLIIKQRPLLPIPDSRFPIPDSRFPIPDSLLPYKKK
ncbi:hypothetical protein BJP36_43395 [Moorena producens JHB]|uniref:Uncharacterized protein n=1 Tax=Moorena producens (strain JHB) TaxID=1454205 RepID=A0A9Q9ST83_MOOP1|nr:hypothetical protein [Moorena producens]WAN69207.1 hypothetical protein BJP36_43395 [Moorena producens JHB]